MTTKRPKKIMKKKAIVRPIKYSKAVISAKSKLFIRANKKNKKVKSPKRVLVKPKKKKGKHIKKTIKPPVKPKKNVKKKTIIKSEKKAVLKKLKIIKKENISAFPAEALFRARIKVVGIGGGGGSIVSEIGRTVNKATFVIADTDIRALKKKTGIKYFWFGKEFTHGLGTGVNPEIARTAAESEKEKITELFKDQDIVILIASLGGGLGSGATKVFAESAKLFGGITLGIFTLPFRFEGKNKSKIALKSLKELKSSLNVSITIPNERIFKVIGNDTSITEAFSTVNKSLIESLESLIDLIYNPGLINIDFADLRTILDGSGNSAFLNTVNASGKDKVKETVEKILINPLYQNNNFIAEKILFNISGGSGLNMIEVEKISKSIAALNPKAKIIFGISKDVKAKNKIKTTILITGPSKTNESIKKVIKADAKVVAKKEQKVKKTFGHKTKGKGLPRAYRQAGAGRQARIAQKLPKNTLSDISLDHILNNNQVAAETSGKLIVAEPVNVKIKKTIRRNALEIKKAEALEQDKRLLQEEEWEIPAFLRRVKFKS
ncbi:MAG: hypothetical protein HY005_02780 [Candidatus Staskawiczbacteria bacterium]|nr:hypothetical protein [Candidatus Staskawiczbacteria bacterium]